MADCTSVLVGNIKIISVINLGLVKRFLAVYFLFRLGELRWEHGLGGGVGGGVGRVEGEVGVEDDRGFGGQVQLLGYC